MKLAGKKAIVTGAAKGMGADITTTLAREGADLVLTARDTAALEEVAKKVRDMGRKAYVVACDVIEEDQVAAMVKKALEVFDGRIDILVNVAGVTGPIETPVQDIKVEDFDYVIIANERGTFLPIKHVAPTMIKQKQRQDRQHLGHFRPARLSDAYRLQRLEMGGARHHADGRAGAWQTQRQRQRGLPGHRRDTPDDEAVRGQGQGPRLDGRAGL